jgi:putative FmdB family regulatory protein
MPTYEYRCKDCDHELEVVQGFHDDPLTECPACGGPLRKKFGSVGISFKGSGFYKNDSRSTSSATASSSESKSSTDTATSSTSTESSPSKSGESSPSKPSDNGSKSTTAAAS